MNETINAKNLDLTAEQLVEMFSSQWNSFAPLAYRYFLKVGRGAFLIDLSLVEVTGREMKPPTFYVPENNLQWLENQLDEKTKNLLKTYDVESMVIFLIKFRDNDIKTMYLGTNNQLASPKQLYEEEENQTIH